MKKSIIALSTVIFLSSGFVSDASAETYTIKEELETTSIDSTPMTTYTVEEGDTLNKIAKKYKLTVEELKKINALSSDKLQIGDLLIVSKTTTEGSATIATVNLIETETHTVVKGDTLSKIAKKYKLTVEKLKKLNALSSDKLQIGDLLIVSKMTVQAVKEESAITTIDSTQTKTHTVVKDDTLSKIAKKYKLTIEKLKKLNPSLATSDVIKIGQKLTVEESASDTETATKDQTMETVIAEAKKVIGAPYLWAGVSPSGFDSSGFMYYAFKQAGYNMSRHSIATYYDLGKSVSSPKPGDLVFFALDDTKAVANHGGIYLGDNEFIHVTVNKGVKISSLTNAYYQSQLIGFKRLSF